MPLNPSNLTVLCLSQLPSAGLGNKLFSWASGAVFSDINQCKHIVTGLTKLHLGPLLRREKSKRFYLGYFRNESLFAPVRSYFMKRTYLQQKDADKKVTTGGCYVFSEIPHWSDHFEVLKNYRDFIIPAFWSNLTPRIAQRIARHSAPEMAVHIRMGDFRALVPGEDFSKVGAVRTPLAYFTGLIETVRDTEGKQVPVTVFSDGKASELAEILALPGVSLADDDLDIVHLAVMSKSKLIVMSAGSTFSFWAGFLSSGILINHFQHIHTAIRPENINRSIYEGPLDSGQMPVLLRNNLLEIF